VPRSARDAELCARAFLQTANDRIGGAGIPGFAGTAIFPPDARLIVCQPVFAQEGNTPDHWLCSFIGYLATGALNSTMP
jgi:hypothetical protein